MAQTLEELKAENAKQEEVTKVTDPVDESDDLADEDSPEIKDEEQSADESERDENSEDDEESSNEAWMASDEDEQASDGGKFTNDDMRGMRLKLKAKLSKKDEEIETLRRQIEELKNGITAPVPQSTHVVPTLEQYDYDEAKYQAAMSAWLSSQVENVTRSRQAQQTQEQAKQRLESAVNSHYERAAKLVKSAGISPELYQGADRVFRETIEDVFPGRGDMAADEILSRLGEGSEKVVYHLGRNSSKREILRQKFKDDPSGLSASVYLGMLLKDVTEPIKKTTKAPAPAARANGGTTGTGSSEASLKKAYQKEDDVQKRFDIRMKAKRAGIDVSNW